MALTDHTDEFPFCAGVPHAILNIQVVYCPHDRGYTLSLQLGDTSSRPWSNRIVRYGPFDDATDMGTDIAQWLKVIFRRPLLDASLHIHEASCDEEDPESRALSD